MKLSDLKPYPSCAEQANAMKKLGSTVTMSREEFKDALARQVQADREHKAAAISAMTKIAGL